MNRNQTDSLRVISIIGVIIIHLTSAAENGFSAERSFLSYNGIGTLMNQIARFSVPLFLFLSGYGLSARYAREITLPLKEFFASRFNKIFIPYFIWSLVFFFLRNDGFHIDQEESTVKNLFANLFLFGEFLLIGKGDYHFYFFPMILQCYLIFPLLIRLRNPVWWPLFMLLHILFTAPAHHWFSAMGLERPRFFSAFIVYWIFFFYSGIFFFQNRVDLQKLLTRWPGYIPAFIAFLSLLPVIIEYSFEAAQSSIPGNYNHFSRQTVMAYFIFTTLLLFQSNWLQNGFRFAGKTGTEWAALSFFVYIFHTWIIRLLQMLSTSYIVLIPLTVLLTFALALSIYSLPLPGILRTILGLPPKVSDNI